MKQLFKLPFSKILLVSSKTRWAATRSLLTSEGIPEERLNIVKTPAGLDIGANSPEEIAISIIAEVIALQRKAELREPRLEKPPEKKEEEIAKDPICGMLVNKATSPHTSYGGVEYYFCCEQCLRQFLENPKLYAHQ